MSCRLNRILTAALLSGGFMLAGAQKHTEVGGVVMASNKTIVENTASSPVLDVLEKAFAEDGLEDILSGRGPYTVFAPTDDAFRKLKAGTLHTLMEPDEKAELKKVLTYHVIPSRVRAKDLKKMVKKGHGSATLMTMEGEPLTVTARGDVILLKDAKGGEAAILTADVPQKNGLIHVVDSVLMPN